MTRNAGQVEGTAYVAISCLVADYCLAFDEADFDKFASI